MRVIHHVVQIQQSPHPRLVPRHEAQQQLGGINVEGIRELERQGRLTPLKFSRAKQAHTYYAQSQIDALVEELLAEAEAAKPEPEPPAPPIKRETLRRR